MRAFSYYFRPSSVVTSHTFCVSRYSASRRRCRSKSSWRSRLTRCCSMSRTTPWCMACAFVLVSSLWGGGGEKRSKGRGKGAALVPFSRLVVESAQRRWSRRRRARCWPGRSWSRARPWCRRWSGWEGRGGKDVREGLFWLGSFGCYVIFGGVRLVKNRTPEKVANSRDHQHGFVIGNARGVAAGNTAPTGPHDPKPLPTERNIEAPASSSHPCVLRTAAPPPPQPAVPSPAPVDDDGSYNRRHHCLPHAIPPLERKPTNLPPTLRPPSRHLLFSFPELRPLEGNLQRKPPRRPGRLSNPAIYIYLTQLFGPTWCARPA